MRARKISPRSSSRALKATKCPMNCSPYRSAALARLMAAMAPTTGHGEGTGAPEASADPVATTAWAPRAKSPTPSRRSMMRHRVEPSSGFRTGRVTRSSQATSTSRLGAEPWTPTRPEFS